MTLQLAKPFVTSILWSTINVLLLVIAPPAEADEAPLVLGAIGDSITTGFNSAHFGDNTTYSWSTGSTSLFASFARKLATHAGHDVLTVNAAVIGSVAGDLAQQVTQVLDYSPAYVTIMIGANDICTWPDDHPQRYEVFKGNVVQAIARMVESRPDVRIVLLPIPDLYRIYEIGRDSMICRAKWRLFNYCQALLGRDRSDDDRAVFVERWHAANRLLADVAEMFPHNVSHDPESANTRFQPEHVASRDCFHPSLAGQALLAEVAWQSMSHD